MGYVKKGDYHICSTNKKSKLEGSSYGKSGQSWHHDEISWLNALDKLMSLQAEDVGNQGGTLLSMGLNLKMNYPK